jgi:hypothetical protein
MTPLHNFSGAGRKISLVGRLKPLTLSGVTFRSRKRLATVDFLTIETYLWGRERGLLKAERLAGKRASARRYASVSKPFSLLLECLDFVGSGG